MQVYSILTAAVLVMAGMPTVIASPDSSGAGGLNLQLDPTQLVPTQLVGHVTHHAATDSTPAKASCAVVLAPAQDANVVPDVHASVMNPEVDASSLLSTTDSPAVAVEPMVADICAPVPGTVSGGSNPDPNDCITNCVKPGN